MVAVGDEEGVAVAGLHRRVPPGRLADPAGGVAELHPVSRLDGPFELEGDASHDVREGVLQREPDDGRDDRRRRDDPGDVDLVDREEPDQEGHEREADRGVPRDARDPHPGPGGGQGEEDDRRQPEEGDPLQEKGDEEDGGRRARELEKGESPDSTQENGETENDGQPNDAAPRFAHGDEEERRPQQEGDPEPDRFRREDG